MKRISVAMAVYEGEKYLSAQIDSILSQLGDDDELVISYNPSGDGSMTILKEYASRDERVRLLLCEKRGVLANFENAIKNCEGEYIFLSDQDDVWAKDKASRVMRAFDESGAALISHDAYICDAQLKVMGTRFNGKKISVNTARNLIKPNYQGAAMAFRRELLPYILPMPDKALYHDMWIGLIAGIYGRVYVLYEPLLYFRRHGNNTSVIKRRGIMEILRDRLSTLRALRERVKELGRKGHKKGELQAWK